MFEFQKVPSGETRKQSHEERVLGTLLGLSITIFVVILICALLIEAAIAGDDEFALEKVTGCAKGASPFIVLMYHRVQSTGGGSELSIPKTALERQLKWLQENDYRSVSLKEVSNMLMGRPTTGHKSILITFDDSYDSDVTLAAPLLEKYGFRGAFFIVTGRLSSDKKAKYLYLKERGHEIGSHSVTHAYLTKKNCKRKSECCGAINGCSTGQIEYELRQSMQDLNGLLGDIKAFAWPGNYYNDETINIAHSVGYALLFSCERQLIVNGKLLGVPGTTKSKSEIFRVEIDGRIKMEDFIFAINEQRPAVISTRYFWKYGVPQNRSYCR